jgi:hypothetical protein
MPRRKKLPPIDQLGEFAVSAVMAKLTEHLREDMTDAEKEDLVDRVNGAAMKAMEALLPELGVQVADNVESKTPRLIKHRRRLRRRFERHLREIWGDALDRLEAMLHAFLELGQAYYQEGLRPDVEEPGALFSALTHLHARACRVTLEILTLLEAGLADGAQARWRTLHEITVVGLVLQEGGEEMADRYLLHEHIADWRAAENFEQHVDLLGWEHAPIEEMEELRAQAAELVKTFGEAFRSDYGWASGLNGKQRPGIADLEAAVEVEQLRPMAKWANDAVHAGPRGLRSLGWDFDLADPNVIPAGMSSAGLSAPGQNTVKSLLLLAGALLTNRPTGDRSAMVWSLMTMGQRAVEAFVAAEEKHAERVNARADDAIDEAEGPA